MFLFGFQRFIAPTVIKFLYYFGLTLTIFGAIGVILYALAEMGTLGAGYSLGMIGATLIGAPITILLMRFSAEIWLVLFEINSRLGQIRDKI